MDAKSPCDAVALGLVLVGVLMATLPERGFAQACGNTCWRLCSSGGGGNTEYTGATIPFSFTGDAAATAATAIDSAALAVNVKDNKTNCGGQTSASSLTMVLPTSCDIRSSAGGPVVATVSSSNLRYVVGGTEVTPGGSPTAAATYSIALRILASANVGSTGGEISCTGGTITPSSTPNNGAASLVVTGTRNKLRWENSSSIEITTLPLTFGGYAETTAGVNVDSNLGSPVQLKLVNAASYPASVTLTTPTGCSIGGTAVTNANVVLYTDASGTYAEVPSGTLSIGSNSLRNYVLRFRAAGGHGLLTGATTCTAGSMTFTY